MVQTLFDEIKAYVGFGPADEARLLAMGPRLEPCIAAGVDDFYARIGAHEGARASITGGDAQVQRLKGTLVAWTRRLFQGGYDEAYYEQRARIGRMHVLINLPQQYMLTAMNALRLHLCAHLRASTPDAEEALQDERSLHKLLDMELAIMLHTYREDYMRQMQRTERLATFGQLVGSIGHELRNPLSVIESSLYLLRSRIPAADERVTRHMDKIGAQVQMSNRIISDLLDIIRDRPPSRSFHEPRTLVDHALEQVPTRPGRLVSNVVPSGLPRVHVDPSQVRQVLVNLVQNGLDAGGEEARVTLSAEAEDGHVVFRVRDNGPGVAAEVRARLFEPLVSTKARGVGLGLALCRKLVERNGGSIRLAESTGSGACFEVRLATAGGGTA